MTGNNDDGKTNANKRENIFETATATQQKQRSQQWLMH